MSEDKRGRYQQIIRSLNESDDAASFDTLYVKNVADGQYLKRDGDLITSDALGALAQLDTVGSTQIDDASVTFAKMQDIATDRLLGRETAGSGDVEEISLAAGLTMASTTLSVVRPYTFTLYSNPVGEIAQTDHPNSLQFLSNTSRPIYQVDLTTFTEARLSIRTTAGSASVNNPRLILKYYTSFSTTAGDYLDIGTSEVSASMTTANTVATSGWVALAAGAKADVFISIFRNGGDGAADPSVTSIVAHFK